MFLCVLFLYLVKYSKTKVALILLFCAQSAEESWHIYQNQLTWLLKLTLTLTACLGLFFAHLWSSVRWSPDAPDKGKQTITTERMLSSPF